MKERLTNVVPVSDSNPIEKNLVQKAKLEDLVVRLEKIRISSVKGLDLEKLSSILENATTVELVEMLNNPNIKATQIENYPFSLLKVENCAFIVGSSFIDEVKEEGRLIQLPVPFIGPAISINFGEGVHSRIIQSICFCCHPYDKRINIGEIDNLMRLSGRRDQEYHEFLRSDFVASVNKAKASLGVDKIFVESGGSELPAGFIDLKYFNSYNKDKVPITIPVSKDLPIDFVHYISRPKPKVEFKPLSDGIISYPEEYYQG